MLLVIKQFKCASIHSVIMSYKYIYNRQDVEGFG